MSNLETLLSEIKSRADKATEGPWERSFVEKMIIYRVNAGLSKALPPKKENIDFILNSRTDVPRLVAALEYCINDLGLNDRCICSVLKDACGYCEQIEQLETILKGANSDG